MSGGVTASGTPTISVTLGQIQSINVEKFQFEKAEDKQLFLDLVNKAYADGVGGEIALDIPRPLNAGELGLVPLDRDRYDSILSSAFDVLMVLRRLGADMEKSSREAKHAAREGEYQTALKAADKIREAAGAEFACAIIAGVIQIGGGIMGARGSIKAMNVGLKPYNIGGTPGATPTAGAAQVPGSGPQLASHRAMPQVPPGGMPPLPNTPGGATPAANQPGWQRTTPSGSARAADDGAPAPNQGRAADAKAVQEAQADRMAIEKANVEAQGLQGKWNAIVQVAIGASAMVNATGQFASKLVEADKAELDAETKKWSYKVDDAKESQDTFHQLKEEMQRMMSEISQSEHQINQQIWS